MPYDYFKERRQMINFDTIISILLVIGMFMIVGEGCACLFMISDEIEREKRDGNQDKILEDNKADRNE